MRWSAKRAAMGLFILAAAGPTLFVTADDNPPGLEDLSNDITPYEAPEAQLGETGPSYETGRLIGRSTSTVGNSTAALIMEDTTSSFETQSNANRTCGDGLRVGSEQCDDGNIEDGDGCSKTCKVEGGYACEPRFVGTRGDKCYVCKSSECTIYHNKAYRCLSTKLSKGKKTALPPVHVREGSGFCKCAPNYCMDKEAAICRPEKGGWASNTQTGYCECGLGHCLLPYAKQTVASPSKFHCLKMSKEYVRATNSSMCQCAAGSPEVISSDPAMAKRFTLPSCKAYPSTPVKKIPHQGPVYAAFSCKSEPYIRGNDTDMCVQCASDACQMARSGVQWPSSTPGNPKNPFYCVSKILMEQMQMSRNPDGSCQCRADECLIPYRDTFKCAPLDGAHPYGGVKLANGRCGCATDADACIMPTKSAGFNATAGFMCLRLKDGGVKTRFGKRYYRGKTGHCKCTTSRCRADPLPSNFGTFRCVDVEKNEAYVMDPTVLAAVKAGSSVEDVKCSCAAGACTLPGDIATRCVKCPTIPGDCRSRCSTLGEAGNTTRCVKYCSTKHVKMKPKPEIGYLDMFEKKNFIARVIRCFISKSVTCVAQPKPSTAKNCTQTVTARTILDCPGRYSKRTSRKLMDGTDTKGFRSVCSRQNYECQKALCNTGASSALCFEKMMLV